MAACAGGAGQSEGITPEAGLSYGQPPALAGRQVMVLPVQSTRGVPSAVQPDAELSYALQERGPEVRWILPDRLRELEARSPAIDLSVERLPVRVFLQAEVRRVGDPLYGHLRRIGGLAGADLALIPVLVSYRPEAPETSPAMEIAAALVNVRNGRVYWFGIVEGRSGGANDPGTLASAVAALARTVVR